ncbi:TPA: hypothetical protein ACGUW9_002621 [Vibrio vulnificus]|nr:hypothetical protein [Vibrio vulnificus]
MEAETQPISALIVLIVVFGKYIENRKISIAFIYVIGYSVLLLPWLLLGMFDSVPRAFLYWALYLLGPIVFAYFFTYYSENKTKKLVSNLICFFVLLSIVQYIFPFSLSNTIEPYLDHFVKRMHMSRFDDARGVGLIFSEPSHAARALWLLIVLQFLYTSNRRLLLFFLITTLIFVLTNKSVTLIFLLFLTFLFWFSLEYKKAAMIIFLLTLLILPLGFISILSLSENYDSATEVSRVGQLLNSVSLVWERGFTLNDLQYFGSIRSISLITGYMSALIEPLGYGLGVGASHTLDNMNLVGFDPSSIWFINNQLVGDVIKPYSYMAQIFQDIGAFAIFFLVFITFKIISIARKGKSKLDSRVASVLFVSCFQLLFYSSTTMPVAWVGLGISLFKLSEKR